ncbi:MAG: hypothetical protein MUC97_19405, partial [Bernardetiaceae bacterium]|nr:hypothetical protein [Bernardetiaceae bacterium]
GRVRLGRQRPALQKPARLLTAAQPQAGHGLPGHSFKFAATLQEKHQGPNPVLMVVHVLQHAGGAV